MNKIVSSFFILLATNISLAHAASNKIPTDLMYLDKPIDALCFSDPDNSTTINLNNCGAMKMKYSVSGKNADLVKKGFTGFDWQDNSNTEYKSQGYSYYKAFDAGQKQYWVYSINGTGGSGDFTAISLVKRTNSTTLSSKDLTGGDRCNGGVQDVSSKHNLLTFSANLTAFDFLPLSSNNTHNLKAYDDLAACAACCAAKAFYEVGSDQKVTLKYIELDNVTKTDEMSQQGKYQVCFNKLYASYVTKGETKLDETKLKKFVKEFNDTCVK